MVGLEEANDRQENFLHFLSHEVKSALGKSRDVFLFSLRLQKQAKYLHHDL